MTNNEIISQYKQLHNITTPLHTYTKWKELGYQVKKGEKSLHKITIWKANTTKAKNTENTETETESTKIFQKTACFFTIEQVQPISE